MSAVNWCRLDNNESDSQALLRFDGQDARTFLQGQLTSDIDALMPATSQYSGYCTPKGRLLASLLIWRRDDAYYLMLPHDIAEPIRKRLSMYILRAKVKAADVTSAHALFGVSGAGAPACVAGLAGNAPSAIHGVVHAATCTALMLPVHRYLIVTDVANTGVIEAALQQSGAAANNALWQQLDIEAGIPAIVAATQEQFVPQTVNYDAIGAVSFSKGCYPGQEIVARTHYLGKLKQRMVRARIVSSDTPQSGDKLYSAAFGDQASGMIVSVATPGADTHDVLATVQSSDVDAGGSADIRWKSPDGPRLVVSALPYVLP